MKKTDATLLYLLFISICLFVSYILKERIDKVTFIVVLRDFFLMTILIAPTWLGGVYALSYLNRKKIATSYFSYRIFRNLCLALIIGIATLLLLFGFRFYIFHDYHVKNVLVKFATGFLINFTVIQFIEYYTYFINSKNKVLKLEREKNKILNLQHKVLKEQINPHFLFNSLNVLSSLIYDNQDKANQYTKELSKLYRYILSTNQQDLVSLNKELRFIKSYFYILQLRFVDAISLEVNIDDSLNNIEDLEIVPLTLQLLVENAIKHNAFSKETPLKTTIEITNHFLIVSNNKNKKPLTEPSTGKGMEYIKMLYKKFDKVVDITETINYYRIRIPLIQRSKINS